jgi:hypothetical protein
MSAITKTTGAITTQTLIYLPSVLAGVQAAEAASEMVVASGGQPIPGSTKLGAVLAGVQAGSQVAAGSPNPDVAAIAALVNLTVSILNALGLFKKKTPAAG